MIAGGNGTALQCCGGPQAQDCIGFGRGEGSKVAFRAWRADRRVTGLRASPPYPFASKLACYKRRPVGSLGELTKQRHRRNFFSGTIFSQTGYRFLIQTRKVKKGEETDVLCESADSGAFSPLFFMRGCRYSLQGMPASLSRYGISTATALMLFVSPRCTTTRRNTVQ